VKKLTMLLIGMTFLSTLALIGCTQSQEPPKQAETSVPEKGEPGASGTPEATAPLPPPIVFNAPPDMIAIPDTNGVYVAPDIGVDLFFWNGWWWRPWEGRWYRSHYYDRDWGYYDGVPSFYSDVHPGWRQYYRDHDWYGHQWDYERIPNERLQQNWKSWHANQYWEKQKAWGVQGYRPRPQQQEQELTQQKQGQYRQRPELQRQPQAQPQRQPQAQRPQPHEQRHPQPQKPQVQPPQVKKPQTQPQKQQVQRPQVKKPQVQPQRQPQAQRAQPQPQRQPHGQKPQTQPQKQQVQPPQVKKPQAQRQPQGQQRQKKPEGKDAEHEK
jgi:hypothetical protein